MDLAVPQFIITFYLVMSVISFALYSLDKRAAIKQKQRISERTLHISSLLGGWLGALIAQQVYRHKTQKKPFKFIFWLTVIVNVLLVFSILRSDLVFEGVNEIYTIIEKML